MDALNTHIDKMMCMMAKKHVQQIATEENLGQTQAHLNAAVGQQNQNPNPPQTALAPPPTSIPNSMILLHNITYPEQFPTNSSKVAFAVSFITDYAATWSQPYLMKIFNKEEVAFNKFLEDFKSSFFDHHCQHHDEVALQSLRQSGTVLAYTQEHQSLVESLLEHGNNRSFLGLSACQLQEVEQVCFEVQPAALSLDLTDPPLTPLNSLSPSTMKPPPPP
ncbi:uncharacterized protein VP01_3009g2 [Puccinia sorghi]|uniref:Retrotransposon gag domain-containing protein n=1 Tax=Puccinia sorghi TaxID=27349 RepID=A0A0L6V0D6_9BASI|nr:uncharacterized protein VP01_3009g2 [Puccinia sorghi]